MKMPVLNDKVQEVGSKLLEIQEGIRLDFAVDSLMETYPDLVEIHAKQLVRNALKRQFSNFFKSLEMEHDKTKQLTFNGRVFDIPKVISVKSDDGFKWLKIDNATEYDLISHRQILSENVTAALTKFNEYESFLETLLPEMKKIPGCRVCDLFGEKAA